MVVSLLEKSGVRRQESGRAGSSRLLTPDCLHHHSTIHCDRLTGQKSSIIGGQEHCGRGHIVRCTPAAQSSHLDYLLPESRVRAFAKGGLDEAGSEDVYTDLGSNVTGE